jgi:hypothetical protein
MASFASLLVPGVTIPQPNTDWISGAADTIVGGIDKYKQNKSFNKLADLIGQQPTAQQAGAQPGLMPQPQSQSFAAPVGAVDRSAPQGDTYQPFIDTVRTKVTNPYGLAAVAATGRAESGWSAGNANRTWSDPSQSGSPGTAGGVMSWRGPRLANLQSYAASKGEQGNGSPQTQGEFLLQENPQLIDQLNNASSPEDAANIMAGAWKFAGYDQQGGEAARRRAMAVNYAAQFRNQPNAASAAIDAQAPGGMGSPLTEQSFDGRFGPTALPAEVAQGVGGLASALTESNAAGMPQQAAQPAAVPAQSAMPLQTQQQPTEVANASSGFAGVPSVQPIPRGGVPIELIQTMLRDPNLREIGVKLWAQNVQGPNNAEPWQFVQGANGTLLRANQVTGQVEPIGNFAKNGTGLGESEAGLNLVYGQDKDGNTIAFQPLKGGGLRQVEIPEGAKLTPGISNIDTGTGTLTVNNKTGLPVLQTAKDLSGAEREKAMGKAQGDAQINLGSNLQKADYSIGLIDQMLAHPGLETAVGLSGTLDPRNYISGTDATDFNVRRKQLEGRAFLEAFDSLKGAGQITEIEGQKATEAIARLSTAQSEGSYKLALRELREILEVGKERARQRATVSEAGVASAPSERKTSSGVQWKIEE